jgi:hypothetical protein
VVDAQLTAMTRGWLEPLGLEQQFHTQPPPRFAAPHMPDQLATTLAASQVVSHLTG